LNPVIHDDIVERVSQGNPFLRRSQFDEIQYGSHAQTKCQRAILRPVITAHGHFRILSHLWPEVKTHIIAHECFSARRGDYRMGAAISRSSRFALVCG
jgi:hypothetical protein